MSRACGRSPQPTRPAAPGLRVAAEWERPLTARGNPRWRVRRPSPAEQAATGAGAGAQSEAEAQKAFRDALIHAWDNPGEEQTLDDAVALLRSEAVAVDYRLPEEDGQWTILMVAAGHKRVPPEVLGNLLSAYSPDLFAQDADGWTALHWAWCAPQPPPASPALLTAASPPATASTTATRR